MRKEKRMNMFSCPSIHMHVSELKMSKKRERVLTRFYVRNTLFIEENKNKFFALVPVHFESSSWFILLLVLHFQLCVSFLHMFQDINELKWQAAVEHIFISGFPFLFIFLLLTSLSHTFNAQITVQFSFYIYLTICQGI